MRRQNDAAILILGEDHRALKNQTLACRTPVALGKYDLPLPYVIALETRGSDSAREDGRRGPGEGGVSVAGDGEVVEGLVGALEDRGRGGISAAYRAKPSRRAAESGEYCADLQAGGTVDWDAGESRQSGERALDAGGCDAGSNSPRY